MNSARSGRRAPVTRSVGRAVCDHVTDLELTLFGGVLVVEVAADPDPGEAARRTQVELDAPLVVSLPEVEAVTVDRAVPLLGREAAVRRDLDALMVGDPHRELGLFGLASCGRRPPFR